jgi:hypothetical protein
LGAYNVFPFIAIDSVLMGNSKVEKRSSLLIIVGV